MASIYGWMPLLAVLLSCLVGPKGVTGQNTTECRDFAMKIVCTTEHPAPPDCSAANLQPVERTRRCSRCEMQKRLNSPAQNPLVACAEQKDNHTRYMCPSIVSLAEAFLKSTYYTVKATCSDHEISNGFLKSPECWFHAATCGIQLNAVPEGAKVECSRFNKKLIQCQKDAKENCASLQSHFFKVLLMGNPCFSESAFQASSAHFPAGLPSVSLFALLTILLVL